MSHGVREQNLGVTARANRSDSDPEPNKTVRALPAGLRSPCSMALRILLTLLCLLTALRTGQAEDRPLLETKYGKLWGVTLPVKETLRTSDAFFGIPFAKPPIGPLRFKNPEAPEPWKPIRDASQCPPVCLQDSRYNLEDQINFKSSFKVPPVSEDCLYLNVFTPSDRGERSDLPVMVYIHGGGLLYGGAGLYDGSALSVYGNAVIVVIQYRLGLLGYFSTGDDQLRGNLGFMDQVAALRWVQENIADFGGDPGSVTIFGASAGGISVMAHVLSPLSKGLFQRAISESGTMRIPLMVVSKSEDLIVYRHIIAEWSGCDPSSVVTCLMRKSEEEMLEIIHNMGFVLLPVCVDGVFLPKPMEEILADMESNDVPLLIGVCNHDFGLRVAEVLSGSRLTGGMSREAARRQIESIAFLNLSSSEISPVMEEYMADTRDPEEVRDRFLDIGTDRIFAMPALRTAKQHRDSGHRVFLYEFQHRPSIYGDSRPDFVKAEHLDDLIYVFGGPFLRDGVMLAGEATDEEKTLAKTIMRYWVNFARNGDPNGPGLAEWPLYDATERYLEIDVKLRVSARLKEDKYKFWTEILPEKSKRADHSEL